MYYYYYYYYYYFIIIIIIIIIISFEASNLEKVGFYRSTMSIWFRRAYSASAHSLNLNLGCELLEL